MQTFLFLVQFLVALANGQVNVAQASSMTSDSAIIEESTSFEWDCGDETCFVIVDSAGVHTGP